MLESHIFGTYPGPLREQRHLHRSRKERALESVYPEFVTTLCNNIYILY